MSSTRFTVIDEQTTHEIDAELSGGGVRLTPATVAKTLGWKLESKGLCRGNTCIPTAGVAGLVSDSGIDLAKLAQCLDRPLAIDVEEHVAALAAPAGDRAQALANLQAPDFTLPDLAGHMHSLSDHRGKKVLLLAHASW